MSKSANMGWPLKTCSSYVTGRVGRSVKVAMTEAAHYHTHAHSPRYVSEEKAPSSYPLKKVEALNAD